MNLDIKKRYHFNPYEYNPHETRQEFIPEIVSDFVDSGIVPRSEEEMLAVIKWFVETNRPAQLALFIARCETSELRLNKLEEGVFGKRPCHAECIATFIKLNASAKKPITKLNLSEFYLSAEDIKIIFDAINETKTIEEITLYKCDLYETAAKNIAEALKTNTTLKKLCLNNNKIGKVGATAIMAALENNSCLEILDMGHNSINGFNPTGLGRNKTLIGLKLNNCKLEKITAISLAKELETNKGLRYLNLRNNRIGGTGLNRNGKKIAGAQALANSLKLNESLWNLDLSRNKLRYEDLKEFHTALQENHSLKILNLLNHKKKEKYRVEEKQIEQKLRKNQTQMIQQSTGDFIMRLGIPRDIGKYVLAPYLDTETAKSLNLVAKDNKRTPLSNKASQKHDDKNNGGASKYLSKYRIDGKEGADEYLSKYNQAWNFVKDIPDLLNPELNPPLWLLKKENDIEKLHRNIEYKRTNKTFLITPRGENSDARLIKQDADYDYRVHHSIASHFAKATPGPLSKIKNKDYYIKCDDLIILNKLARANHRIDQLNLRIDQLKKESNTLKRKLNNFRTEQIEQQSDKEKLEVNKAKLEAEEKEILVNKERKNSQLRSQPTINRDQAVNEINKLSKDYQSIKTQIREISVKIKSTEGKINSKQEEINSMEQKIELQIKSNFQKTMLIERKIISKQEEINKMKEKMKMELHQKKGKVGVAPDWRLEYFTKESAAGVRV